MIVVAVITFGHDSADIETSLRSAVELAQAREDLVVISVDDKSGYRASAQNVESFEVPSRMGFPGVVEYIYRELFPEARRLILINPDAVVDNQLLTQLVETDATIALPSIGDRQGLINVRPVTTARAEFLNLLIGERRRFQPLKVSKSEMVLNAPPYAPSGAVISIEVNALHEVALDPDFFWLEFSDWVLRRASFGLATQIKVLPRAATHTGASTSISFPLSVAASQARAKVLFIFRYGNWAQRVLTPIALFSRALRFGLKQRSLKSGLFVFEAGRGRRDWRVAA